MAGQPCCLSNLYRLIREKTSPAERSCDDDSENTQTWRRWQEKSAATEDHTNCRFREFEKFRKRFHDTWHFFWGMCFMSRPTKNFGLKRPFQVHFGHFQLLWKLLACPWSFHDGKIWHLCKRDLGDFVLFIDSAPQSLLDLATCILVGMTCTSRPKQKQQQKCQKFVYFSLPFKSELIQERFWSMATKFAFRVQNVILWKPRVKCEYSPQKKKGHSKK